MLSELLIVSLLPELSAWKISTNYFKSDFKQVLVLKRMEMWKWTNQPFLYHSMLKTSLFLSLRPASDVLLLSESNNVRRIYKRVILFTFAQISFHLITYNTHFLFFSLCFPLSFPLLRLFCLFLRFFFFWQGRWYLQENKWYMFILKFYIFISRSFVYKTYLQIFKG